MQFKYQKYSFTLKARETIEMPPYKGSTLRGGFGTSFKRIVCLFRNKQCRECQLNGECAYSYIFETPAINTSSAFRIESSEAVPHPFIIEPPLERTQVYEAGSEFSFNLILIGKATKYLLYFIMAFEQLGELGIGKGRGRYELVKVEVGDSLVYSGSDRITTPVELKSIEVPEEIIPAEEGSLMINFLTPTRIKFNREYVNKIEFFVLITSLMRRLALLYIFHCDGNPPSWDHRLIIEQAKKIDLIENDTGWYDWERYSHRQRTRMKLGGVVGRAVYKGEVKGFLPILKAGELFHVGKGTSFGLGMFRWEFEDRRQGSDGEI
ncbi:MAG: CRISPR system precrRNA processing endoribonuclease RAMP protein Cas6 [Candidatus Saccharicenans sp.]